MFNRFVVLATASLLCGCASPAGLIQATSDSLSGILARYSSYEQFKASMKNNASYARLSYADMSRSGFQKRFDKAQQLSDVCLRYSLAESVKRADIQKRFSELKNLLDKSAQFLCSTDTAVTIKEGGICPVSNGKSTEQKVLDFFNAFASVASLTPAALIATVANSGVQTGVAVYQFSRDQLAYRKAIEFLAARKTQRTFKYAVERLESDLENADDDLEKNMRTWTTCERARLEIASNNLDWNDGASQIIFSKEAVEFQKELDTVEESYNAFKTTIPNTQKSLSQLQVAFAKLPNVDIDPSVIPDLVKSFTSTKDNIDKLNASNARAMYVEATIEKKADFDIVALLSGIPIKQRVALTAKPAGSSDLPKSEQSISRESQIIGTRQVAGRPDPL